MTEPTASSRILGAPGVRSRDDFIEYLRGELATFPDSRETIEDIVADGDKVTAEYIAICRLEDNASARQLDSRLGFVEAPYPKPAATLEDSLHVVAALALLTRIPPDRRAP
jgi:hypothetical protein